MLLPQTGDIVVNCDVPPAFQKSPDEVACQLGIPVIDPARENLLELYFSSLVGYSLATAVFDPG